MGRPANERPEEVHMSSKQAWLGRGALAVIAIAALTAFMAPAARADEWAGSRYDDRGGYSQQDRYDGRGDRRSDGRYDHRGGYDSRSRQQGGACRDGNRCSSRDRQGWGRHSNRQRLSNGWNDGYRGHDRYDDGRGHGSAGYRDDGGWNRGGDDRR
jgi:hypothetical protein